MQTNVFFAHTKFCVLYTFQFNNNNFARIEIAFNYNHKYKLIKNSKILINVWTR